MEIEDLKEAWQQYDIKLSASLKLNEAMLKKANLNASRMELRKPLQFEILNLVILILVLPAFALITLKYREDITYLTAGIVFCTTLLAAFILTIKTIKSFYDIDYYGSSIIQLQEQLATLNRQILRSRKMEMLLIPLYTIPPTMILLKLMHNIDFHDNPAVLIVTCFLVLILTYAGVLLIYKYLYEKKMKNVEILLNEIRNFKEEN